MKSRLRWLQQYLEEPLHRNAIFLMANQVTSAILGFIFWLIAARLYSAEEVGIATALISAMLLVATISMLGYDIGLIRFLPTTENKRDTINTCLTISGLLSIVVAIIFIVGSDIWSPKLTFIWEKWYYSLTFILFTLLNAIGMLQGQVFVALRRTEYQFIQGLISILKFLPVVLLTGFGAFGIFSSLNLVTALTVVTGFFFIIKIYPGYQPFPIIRKKPLHDMAGFTAINYVASNLQALPIRIMPLLILALVSPEAGAYFYISYHITAILGMIPASISTSLFAEGSHQPAMLKSQVIRAAKFTVIFLIPGVIVLFFLGDKILSFFSVEYAQNSLWMMRFLALSWLPASINLIYTSVIRVQMKTMPLLYVYATTAIITIGAGCVLMKWLGLTGIGIAWLLAQSLVALVVGPLMLKMARISIKTLLKPS